MSCFSKSNIKIHPLDSSIVPKEELTCVICKKKQKCYYSYLLSQLLRKMFSKMQVLHQM